MQKIRFNTSDGYDVYVGSGILNECGEIIIGVKPFKRAVIVTDDIVGGLYKDTVLRSLRFCGMDVSVFTFKNGEQSKCHETLLELYDFMIDNSVTRSDLIVALGGGVVGDLAGFAAATYLRGIDVVQIPTTLLAQTDSSLGGKTAVDIKKGKNLVGAFKQPLCVITDFSTLHTLSDEIFDDGMAEIIKYGMIKSSELFNLLSDFDAKDNLEKIISMCINIKRQVVENDERDKGERMLLNFGHTIGHSIEKYYNYTGITHGRAVGIGMAVITKAAVDNGICDKISYDRLVQCLKKYNLDVSTNIDMNELLAACLSDKKRDGDYLNVVLCSETGKSRIDHMKLADFHEFMGGKV